VRLRVLVAFVFAVLFGSPAWAQTITNTRTGTTYPSLQAAVSAALAGDTISIGPGTVTGSVTVDANVTIEGAGDVLTTVSALAGTSIIDVAAGQIVTIKDLTISSSDTSRRGVLVESGATLTISNARFDTAYTAALGGNIYFDHGASLTATDVTFLGKGVTNLATNGGALYAIGTGSEPVTLTRVTFVDSKASTNGGAVNAQNVALTCDGCVFDSPNAASSGGALYVSGGSLTVRRSRICSASATSGGGIWSNATTVVTNTIFGQDSAGTGAAAYADASTWTVTNNHFIGNTGSPAFETKNNGAVPTVKNNLFLDNSDLAVKLGLSSSPVITYNYLQGNGGTVGNFSGTFPGTNRVDQGDPQLVGSITDCLNAELYPTPLTSPLIDIGDPAIFDLDGTRSDIGAFGGPETDPASPVADDADSDGSFFLHDCDDADGANFPGNEETCAAPGDNDCDGLDDDADPDVLDQEWWHLDCDVDGHGEPSNLHQCFAPTLTCAGGQWLTESADGAAAGDDCDDGDASVHPGADEYCNLVDDDCDFLVDDDAVDAARYYTDLDDDGYGDDHTEVRSCLVNQPGTSTIGGDCNDSDDTIHPGVPDPCGDDVDQDCGGADGDPTNSDPYYPDIDDDGFGDRNVEPVYSCVPRPDDVTDGSDCNDTDSAVHPGAEEVCNLVDDDCDDLVDDVGAPVAWYQDTDADGYGDDVFEVEDDCAPGDDWVLLGGDCDDSRADVSPAATEACDGYDDNCDGLLDDEDPTVIGAEQRWIDLDQDGYGACDPLDPECRPKPVCLDYTDQTWADNPDDCDDQDPQINPSRQEEPGNFKDEDCSGTAADPPTDDQIGGGGGCNCDSSGATGSSVAWLLGGLLLTYRRRR
jgi:hypothetical protein